ncbi:MAG: pilus assembly protein PilP [Bdellovibrionales bacterium]|nr:pilus assembly protein PilP [Bdellovibrionales bacterium]
MKCAGLLRLRQGLVLSLALGVGFARAQSAPSGSPEEATEKSGDTWTFNPLHVKRDPFEGPPEQKKASTNELRRFDLNEINLVAILTGLGAPQAMLVLPNGKTHIVQIGDDIGRHNGRVYKITATEVVVVESFLDFRGRTKKSYTNLVIAQ